MNRKSYIYKITNKVNGKVYIGQTNDFERRKEEHIKEALSDGKGSPYLYHSMRKHGIHNFDFEVIERVRPEGANEAEIKQITLHKSFGEGYNLTSGGDNKEANRILSEDDVILIREIYNSKTPLSREEVWKKYFEEKITFNTFVSVWQGSKWSFIMPEVFTEENKEYYESRKGFSSRIFSVEEVRFLRTVRSENTFADLYSKYGEERCSISAFKKMLLSETYTEVPSVEELMAPDSNYEEIKIEQRVSGARKRRTLSDEEVIELRSQRPNYTLNELYEIYGKGKLSMSGFQKALYGGSYGDLPSIKELTNGKKAKMESKCGKLTDEEVINVRRKYATGKYGRKELYRKTIKDKVAFSSFERVIYDKTYTNLPLVEDFKKEIKNEQKKK